MSYTIVPFDVWKALTSHIPPGGWDEATAIVDLRQHQVACLFDGHTWPSISDWEERWGWGRKRIFLLMKAEERWSDPKLLPRWRAFYDSAVSVRSHGVRRGEETTRKRPGNEQETKRTDEGVFLAPEETTGERAGNDAAHTRVTPDQSDQKIRSTPPFPLDGVLAQGLAALFAGGVPAVQHRLLIGGDKATLQRVRDLLIERRAWPVGTRLTALHRQIQHDPPPIREETPPPTAAIEDVDPTAAAQLVFRWWRDGDVELALSLAAPWIDAQRGPDRAFAEALAEAGLTLAGGSLAPLEGAGPAQAGTDPAAADPAPDEAPAAAPQRPRAVERGQRIARDIATWHASSPAEATARIQAIQARLQRGPILEVDLAAIKALRELGLVEGGGGSLALLVAPVSDGPAQADVDPVAADPAPDEAPAAAPQRPRAVERGQRIAQDIATWHASSPAEATARIQAIQARLQRGPILEVDLAAIEALRELGLVEGGTQVVVHVDSAGKPPGSAAPPGHVPPPPTPPTPPPPRRASRPMAGFA